MTTNRTETRTYTKTHPWLTFSVDLRRAPVTLWAGLGECQSKCEHIAGVPLRPETAQRLYRLYLAKGVLATTAIEGNTLSEEEVLQHLEGKLELPPSRSYLKQEIGNILSGCNSILEDIKSERLLALNSERAGELNRIVLEKLTLEDGVVPGTIRRHEVGVARYKGAPAEDCDYLLNRLCEWLNGEDFQPQEGMRVGTAILKAVVAHLYLAWIHPFGDGNGRTARLIEFQILISSGVPAPATHLLSNHYNQTRTEYYRLLDQSSRSENGAIQFITYAVQGLLDGLRSQLDHIRRQHWNVAWENFVHGSFRGKTTQSKDRRKQLVLDLSEHSDPVPFSRLPEISPRVAATYAGKTRRTLTRDVNALSKMGLVEKGKTGVRARKEIILAFLPIQAGNLENNKQ